MVYQKKAPFQNQNTRNNSQSSTIFIDLESIVDLDSHGMGGKRINFQHSEDQAQQKNINGDKFFTDTDRVLMQKKR